MRSMDLKAALTAADCARRSLPRDHLGKSPIARKQVHNAKKECCE